MSSGSSVKSLQSCSAWAALGPILHIPGSHPVQKRGQHGKQWLRKSKDVAQATCDLSKAEDSGCQRIRAPGSGNRTQHGDIKCERVIVKFTLRGIVGRKSRCPHDREICIFPWTPVQSSSSNQNRSSHMTVRFASYRYPVTAHQMVTIKRVASTRYLVLLASRTYLGQWDQTRATYRPGTIANLNDYTINAFQQR
jgi:hypothetical protein